MANITQELSGKFNGTKCYKYFGQVIKSMTIDGFRGINNLQINFGFPITAISGLNGSGKSTICQLAVCGFQRATWYSPKRLFVSDFFPANRLDPNPFTDKAKVKFQYSTINSYIQNLTVYRSNNSSWDGYKRQPPRNSYYVGFALFIPKVEIKDISIEAADTFIIDGDKRLISDKIRKQVSSILNSMYEEVAFQKITHGEVSKELGLVKKHGSIYSENNMGFGEARLLYMVDLLENSPDKSLFVLEEPETSLHEDAQLKLVHYLMDVCNRKGHQLIISTHSSIILEALPLEGIKFLTRDKTGVKIIGGLSANRAKSLLTDGSTKALIICVEDEFAKLLLQEAILRLKPDIITQIDIYPLGDKKVVENIVTFLRNINQKVIGIRDGDTGENKSRKLFKLPGKLAPEKEIYEIESVKNIINKLYNIDCDSIFARQNSLNHHNYGSILAYKTNCDVKILNIDAIRAYLDIKQGEFESLINIIESEM
jgi:predicted ATPase